MKVQQSGTAWLAWRGKGLGSSDAPIIMGVSPWCSAHVLWQLKTGRLKRDSTPNYAQQMGINKEPKARARYELLNSIECPPMNMEHSEFPHFRVSLDGYNEDNGGLVLEIKCPGLPDHMKAKSGVVPEKYVYQLEMQLFVSGAAMAHYFSYYEDKLGKVDTVLIEYKSDPKLRTALIEKLHEFWACVKENRPPELSAKDPLVLEDLSAVDVFDRLAKVMESLDETTGKHDALEAQYKELKSMASRFLDRHPRVRCRGVELMLDVKGGVRARLVD